MVILRIVIPAKREDLCWVPSTQVKKKLSSVPGWNQGRDGSGIPEAHWPASLAESMSFGLSNGLPSQKIQMEGCGGETANVTVVSTCMCTYVHTPTHQHTVSKVQFLSYLELFVSF